MNKNLNNDNNNHDESHIIAACRRPEIGSQLPAYIVDLLDDDAAFQVEQHLVECKHCKERYLSVLRVKSEASRKRDGSAPDNDAAGLSHESFERGVNISDQ